MEEEHESLEQVRQGDKNHRILKDIVIEEKEGEADKIETVILGNDIAESQEKKEGIKIEDLMQVLVKMDKNRKEDKEEVMKRTD